MKTIIALFGTSVILICSVISALILCCLLGCVPAHAQTTTSQSLLFHPKTTLEYNLSYGDLIYHLPINHPGEEAFIDSLLISYAKQINDLQNKLDIQAGQAQLDELECMICLYQSKTYRKYRKCMLTKWLKEK